jgi:hypothetical protein
MDCKIYYMQNYEMWPHLKCSAYFWNHIHIKSLMFRTM